jgi:chemotaxis protein CheZ
MAGGEAEAIVEALRGEIERAADVILTAAEQALRKSASARTGDRSASADVERALLTILEACAFQDLAGQRLARLAAILADTRPADAAPVDPLLYGPALPGDGLDQAAADALFGAA